MNSSHLALIAAALIAPPLVGQDAGTAASEDARKIPPGHGTLNQDKITLVLHSGSLDIRVTPLDDQLLVLLAPDAYQGIKALLASRKERIDSALSRAGIRQPSIFMVTFFARDNNTSFDPRLLSVSLRNTLIVPAATVAFSASFSAQVIDTRRQALGLVIFDRPIAVTEPFALEYNGSINQDWGNRLTQLDNERSNILSRIGASGPDGGN